MQKVINKEIILLRYFNDLLSNGNTSGVTKNEYNYLLNQIVKTINLSSFSILKFNKVSDDEFINIINNANKINKEKHPFMYNGIKIDKTNNQLIAKPTYSLVKNNHLCYELDPVENALINYIALKKTKIVKMSHFDINDASKEELDIAVKVSSYFINDVIERYITNRISTCNWPIQCKNIDEYVFKRDIAKLINEPGTAKNFRLAYLHAIKITCELLKESKSEFFNRELYFSNNDENLLAFANYVKFFLPKQLNFLSAYKYNKYESSNESRSLSVVDDNVYKSKRTFIHSIVQNMPDDDLQESVYDEDVKVMEKRIIIMTR